MTKSATGGMKGMKPAQLAWADPRSLLALGEVYGYGSLKYTPTNYRKGYDWSLSFNAMQRHLFAFWGGEDVDPESGLSHLMHAAWHCLALHSFTMDHPEYDDRHKPVADASLPVDVAETVVNRVAANSAAWREEQRISHDIM